MNARPRSRARVDRPITRLLLLAADFAPTRSTNMQTLKRRVRTRLGVYINAVSLWISARTLTLVAKFVAA